VEDASAAGRSAMMQYVNESLNELYFGHPVSGEFLLPAKQKRKIIKKCVN
jgi:hypothetical protein